MEKREGYPLTEGDCMKIGGHCYVASNIVIATNPPIHTRICRHCGKRQESTTIPLWEDVP